MRKCRIFSLVICLVLLLNMGVSSMADWPATGKLTVHILETTTKTPIKDARVTIYQIAAVSGNSYALTEKFAACGFDVDTIDSLTASTNKAEAEKLVQFVSQNSIAYTKTMNTNAAGAAEFADISLGLYLVTNPVAPKGHKAISPFLITIPQRLENNEYNFEVDAAPKTGTADPTPTPTATPRPTNTPSPTITPRPSGTIVSRLPQTGQLWWPVYAMAALGLVLVLYGWIKRRESSDE